MQIERKESALIQELISLLDKNKIKEAKRFIRGRDMRRFTTELEAKKTELLEKLPDEEERINAFVAALVKALSPHTGDIPRLLHERDPDVERIKRELDSAQTNLIGLESIEDKLKGSNEVDECIQRLAEQDHPVFPILLATKEQMAHYSKQSLIGKLKTRVLKNNAEIRTFLQEDFTAGFLIVISENADLIADMKYWARRSLRFNQIVVMFNKEHYQLGRSTVDENLSDSILDLTKKISRFQKGEIF